MAIDIGRRELITLLGGATMAWRLAVPGCSLTAVAIAAVLALTARDSVAQNFPTRPVTFIVPWPAGSTTDVALRPLVAATEKQLVVNRDDVVQQTRCIV